MDTDLGLGIRVRLEGVNGGGRHAALSTINIFLRKESFRVLNLFVTSLSL